MTSPALQPVPGIARAEVFPRVCPTPASIKVHALGRTADHQFSLSISRFCNAQRWLSRSRIALAPRFESIRLTTYLIEPVERLSGALPRNPVTGHHLSPIAGSRRLPPMRGHTKCVDLEGCRYPLAEF